MNKEAKEKKGIDAGEQQSKKYPVIVVADDYGDQLTSFEPNTPIVGLCSPPVSAGSRGRLHSGLHPEDCELLEGQ